MDTIARKQQEGFIECVTALCSRPF